MSLEVFSLKGKTALVCGASQGIGRAIARAYVSAGAKVVGLARTESKLKELQEELTAQKFEALVCDIEDHVQLKEKVEHFLKQRGSIHILVNNSAGPEPGPILNAKPESFEQAFHRHLLSAQLLTQLLVPGMRSEQYGRIINIISTSVREPIPNLGVSNTIRGAMASWAKTLASELPPGVTINNILPGYTNTPRLESLRQNTARRLGVDPETVERQWLQVIPEGRIAHPDELAWPAVFLASPASSYIRGISLTVDGGRMKGV